MSQLVSIIMPAYNAEKYIAESIHSVIEQTYRNWELIVVNDGSTDKTAKIVQGFLHDGRIKHISQPNGRLGKARNTGIKTARGSLIAFVDADDLWVKEKLELQMKAIENERAGLVFSDGFIFYGNDAANETLTFSTISGKLDAHSMLDLLLVENRIPVLSVLTRKDLLNEAGLFEEALPYHGCEDYDMWLKLAERGAVFYGMKERLVRYRRHPAAMTSCESNALKPMIAVVKRHLHKGDLSVKQRKLRIRNLYRDLVFALVKEGRVPEAKDYMKELSAQDTWGIITAIQKALLEISPSKYNFISRECLYRTEWHLKKIFG